MTVTAPQETPLRILAWPASAPTNRYTGTLYANMTGVVVDDFKPGLGTLRVMLRKRYDIFHIHWLERAFWREGHFQILRAVIITLLAVCLLKLKGTALVWTAHDPVPHELEANKFTRRGPFSLVWKVYRALLRRMLDGIILLSRTHRSVITGDAPYLEKLPFTVTPHPHFKDVYRNTLSRAEARQRLDLPENKTVLLLLGVIRPYKNAEALIEAFRDLPGDDLRLLIAGKPDSQGYANTLETLAKGDPRIIFHFAFVADDDLQLFLNASDAVVIPFRNATNSGSVALALSFSRPVAVPSLPVFSEVQEIVGESWLRLMPGTLSPQELANVIQWVGQPRPEAPDLSALDWSQHAAQTASFFRSVMRKLPGS